MSTKLQTQAKATQMPSSISGQTGFLQRRCACGQHTIAGRECAECSQKRQETLQHAAVSPTPVNVEPSVADEASRSPGQPHSSTAGAFADSHFDHDFSQVRVHTNSISISGLNRTSTQLLGGAPVAPVLGAPPPAASSTPTPKAAAPKAVAVTISSTDVSPKTFSPCGQFQWQIGWSTTGRSGFIVQEINNTYTVTDCKGSPTTKTKATPQYWEAWNVDATGKVTPNVGATHDLWYRPKRPNTKGIWSQKGYAYWVTTLDPAAGFSPNKVPDAGILNSTTTAPKGLGSSLLNRSVGGKWDCCGGKSTHTEIK